MSIEPPVTRPRATRSSIDVASGKIDLVVRNPGIGLLYDVTADGRYGLLSRVQSRGNNNLHLSGAR